METEEGVQPNTVRYNTVINSISKSDDENAAEHSLEVLKRIEKLHKGENKSSVRPDVFSYTTVINALSRSKKPGAPQKAKELLEKMVTISHNGDENVFPNTVTINSVISTYVEIQEGNIDHKTAKHQKTELASENDLCDAKMIDEKIVGEN